MLKHEQLTNMVTPIVTGLGLECVGVEYQPTYGNALMRVYIDAPGRPINVHDCEVVSRRLSEVLDADSPIQERYTLEVSSPGLDRPLFTPEHFARFIGRQAKLSLTVPLDGRRRFQGPIHAVAGATITLEQDGALVDIAHSNIQKAHLVPEYRTVAAKKKVARK